jgi:hypothetical protein
MKYTYKQLRSPDIDMFKALMQIFAQVFEDSEIISACSDDEYIRRVLSDDSLWFVIVTRSDWYRRLALQNSERKKTVYLRFVVSRYQRQGAGRTIVAIKIVTSMECMIFSFRQKGRF